MIPEAEFRDSTTQTASSCWTHSQQVQQVRVGVDVRRRVLDERQLLKDGVQLLGFGQVDPSLVFVRPVWQRHVHGYQVLQVHSQDGESES